MHADSVELIWNCPPQGPRPWGTLVCGRDICHAKDRTELLRNEKEPISMLIIIIIMTIRYLIITET